MVAFETPNLEEASEGNYLRYLGYCPQPHSAMGNILSASSAHTRTTRYRDVSGNMARRYRRYTLFPLCQPPRLLLNSHDTHLNMLHIDMDKGK